MALYAEIYNLDIYRYFDRIEFSKNLCTIHRRYNTLQIFRVINNVEFVSRICQFKYMTIYFNATRIFIPTTRMQQLSNLLYVDPS